MLPIFCGVITSFYNFIQKANMQKMPFKMQNKYISKRAVNKIKHI